ncbi:uncharacterized protein LOC124543632 [Vanessa cardui]|uniref:uncharacterized protein LOC124543632 n=1 Tax=Vanessa cardui TaxID=171605 RepID=UPI001F13DF7A|nr:uncharacterized protein LOC124543632 [Vanessa cardui]
MGFFIYFVFIGIQLTSTLATDYQIPLRCFLQSPTFLDKFDTNSDVTLPRFNTLRVKNVTLDKDDWVFETYNLDYDGLDDAALDEFGFNLNTKDAKITFHTDLVAKHLYKTSGTLFSKPIDGEGHSVIKLSNVQYSFKINFDIIENDGRRYIELKDYEYTYVVRDDGDFALTHLYNGNKRLSNSMLCRMNKNWRYLTTNFGRIFMDEIASNVFNKFKDYLLAMPLKDCYNC